MRAAARGLSACLVVALMVVVGCSSTPPEAVNLSSAPTVAAPPPEQMRGFDEQRAYAQLETVTNFGPRPSGSEALRREQEYLRSQLQNYGCAVGEDDFHASTPLGSVPMKNILAKVPGQRSGIILLLTHYETLRLPGFVGADDPGSSTAVLLELARLLCAPTANKNPLGIWIGFVDGEEAFVQWSDTDSTYGSRELAARLALSGDLKRIKAVLLADMVGPRNLEIRRESNSTPWLTEVVWSTAKRLGYQQYFLDATTTIEDDHLSFLRRGVPAVDIIDLDYPYWHTTEDTVDKISPQSMAIVGQVILASLDELGKIIR